MTIWAYKERLLRLQGVNKSSVAIRAYKEGLFPDQRLSMASGGARGMCPRALESYWWKP